MPCSQTIVETFSPSRVRPLPDQPRKRFRGIRELADSIAEIGQSCPGIVTRVHDDPDFDARLVDGERRLRACKLAGVEFRAEVRVEAGTEEIFVASFAANFGKQDHDCIEIAEGLDRMHRAGKTIEQLARIAGKSVCWVIQYMHLLKLHPDVQAMMIGEGDDDSPRLSFHLAQSLVPVAREDQPALAARITKGGGMSGAAARRFILKHRSNAGDEKAYTKSNGSRRKLTTINSILEETSDRIGVYLDMPGSEFGAMVDAMDNGDKRQLIESLRDTAESLTVIADTIGRRLPKPILRTA